MHEIHQKTEHKSTENKILRCAKPHGKGVIGIYIMDVLQTSTSPVTVRYIQQSILTERGVYYKYDAIVYFMYNLERYSNTVIVHSTITRAGKSRAIAFSIQKKSDNELS